MADPLKPWTGFLATAFLAAFVLFTALIAVLMIVTAPSLKATVVTKGLVVVLAASGVGAAISTLMWSLRWRRIEPQVRLSQFVRGTIPTDPQALVAWRWRRRFRLCWVLTMLTMVGIVIAESLAGHW